MRSLTCEEEIVPGMLMCSKGNSGWCWDCARPAVTMQHSRQTNSSLTGLVFWVRYEDKVGKLFVDNKEAAKFVRIFIGLLEVFLLVGINYSALNKFVQESGIIIPLCFGLVAGDNN